MGLESLFTQIFHVIDEEIEFKENSIVEKMMHACPFKGCEAVFQKRNRLEDHINTHTGEFPFKCKAPGCNKQYHSRNSLRKHVRALHEDNASLYTTFIRCPYPNCMMELRNRGNLHKHYQRLHTGQFKYVCQYCDKGFHKHTQLQNHVYHHTGIPPLRCATCDAGFVYQRDLNRHLRGHRKWDCDLEGCGEVFASWNDLRKHLSTHHSGEFVCEECQKTFKTKYALRMHVLCHLEETSRPRLQCPYENCERFYFQKQNLNHHIQFKHEGKTHECEECGMGLCTKAKLTEHRKLIHARHKPVQAKKQTSPRKTRKDAGIPHHSMAAKLSGATIPYKEEKLLLKNEYKLNEVEPLAEIGVNVNSSFQAPKRKVAKRKSSEKPGCIGCSSGCASIGRTGSQELKLPEAMAITDSKTETTEDMFKSQRHLPEFSPVKCDIDGLLPDEGSKNSLYYDRLDTKSEQIKQNYTDQDDLKNLSASSLKCVPVPSSPGNLQSTEQSALDYKHVYNEVQNISNEESGKVNSECNVNPSVLERTNCLLNYKKEPDHDMDADDGQDVKKQRCQVYDLKKWILAMTRMMELVCPEVCSES